MATRTQSLDLIFKKLVIAILCILSIMTVLMIFGGDFRVLTMMFIAGNIGGYAAIHKNLSDYTDEEIHQLSQSWFALILPPIIGGILSMLLYAIFISGIISGKLFPSFVFDNDVPDDFSALFAQHAAGPADYAKLIFWGFVAGFNEKYVTNIIESIKAKAS